MSDRADTIAAFNHFRKRNTFGSEERTVPTFFLQLPEWFPDWVPALIPEAVTAILALTLIAALLTLLIALVALTRARRLTKHYRTLMTGQDGTDLLSTLEATLARPDAAEQQASRAAESLRKLDVRTGRAIQHVNLLKYSALGEQDGEQSFSLALLDGADDGVVVSALHTRGQGMRIYAKPVKGGRSPYALTTEEQRVVSGGIESPSEG